MNYYVFDIETGPLPQEQAMRVAPEFSAPSNYKDEAKKAAYIEEAKKEWAESWALDPMTGQVLAVGFLKDSGEFKICERNNLSEEHLIGNVFQLMDATMKAGGLLLGFNVRGFDIPFLVRRAYILGVHVPGMIVAEARARYTSFMLDVQEAWLVGSREYKGQSLDRICKACRLPGKTGEGKDFAKLYAEDRDKAIAYLENDLYMTHELAKRFGLV